MEEGAGTMVNHLKTNLDNIQKELNTIRYKIESNDKDQYFKGYKEGFETGCAKAIEVYNAIDDIKNIDMESIRLFSSWCYINGIDFSYMAKSTDKIPFTEKVIKRFKEDIEKDQNSEVPITKNDNEGK